MSKTSEHRKRVCEDNSLRTQSPNRLKIAEEAQGPEKDKDGSKHSGQQCTFTSLVSGVQYEQIQRVKSASPNTPPKERIDPGFQDYRTQVTRRGLQALQVELESGRMDYTIWTNDHDELTERGSFWSLHTRPEGAIGEIDCDPKAKEKRVEKWCRDVTDAVDQTSSSVTPLADRETETG